MSISQTINQEQICDFKNMLDLAILSYVISKSQLYVETNRNITVFDTLLNQINFIPSLLPQSKTISVVSKDYKILYIVFAGTHDVNDEISDVEISQVCVNTQLNIKFHEGFHNQFIALQENITSVVNNFTKAGGTNICLIGHSSGGCVASITAYYLSCVLHINNLKVVTYGSPYFTNSVGAQWFENNCNYTRIEIHKDPVPQIPTMDIELQNYVHVDSLHIFIKNKIIYINKLYKTVSPCNFILKLLRRRSNIYYHRTETYKNKLNQL